MPIYLKVGDIKGDATQEDHEDWTDIKASHWCITRNFSGVPGSMRNREAKEPTISEFIVSKAYDSSSVNLIKQAFVGNESKTVQIHFVSTGNPGETYLEFTLYNTILSHYSFECDDGRPYENIRLNFTKIEINDKSTDVDNKKKSQSVINYDLAKATCN